MKTFSGHASENGPVILEAVRSSKRVLITSHLRSDGDSIGSQLALRHQLSAMGIESRIVNFMAPAPAFSYLPGFDDIEVAETLADRYDLTFVLDVPGLERLGFCRIDRETLGTIVNIDHHLSNCRFADHTLWDPEISSTCELISDLVESWDQKLSLEAALCVYTGLMTDSGNLTYRAASPKTYRIAADLLALGIDHYLLFSRAYRSNSRGRLALLGTVLRDFELTPDGRIAWYVVEAALLEEVGCRPEEAFSIIGQMMTKQDLEMALVFIEDGKDTIIEFRTADSIDASKVAGLFGGGGHLNAAGACVPGRGSDVAAMALGEISRYLAGAGRHAELSGCVAAS